MSTETLPAAEAKPGHNNPPEETPLEKMLREISERNSAVLTRARNLLNAAKSVPPVISETPDPAETAEKLTTLVSQLTACINKTEEARTTEKDPHLKAGKIIDTFFNANKDALAKVKKGCLETIKVYMDEEHKKEQQRQEKAAKDKADEARALTTIAVAMEGVNTGAAESALDEALQSEEMQVKHEVAASQTTGLVAVRSASGGTAALRTTKTIVIDDLNKLDLEKLRFLIPLPALQTACNAYMRQGGTELAGTTIKTDTSVAVR